MHCTTQACCRHSGECGWWSGFCLYVRGFVIIVIVIIIIIMIIIILIIIILLLLLIIIIIEQS